MTIDNVIMEGEQIDRMALLDELKRGRKKNSILRPSFITGIILIVIATLLARAGFLSVGRFMLGMGFMLILIILLTIFIRWIFEEKKGDLLYKERLEEWRKQYVIPFIEALPEEQHPVLYIKMKPMNGMQIPYGCAPLFISYKKGEQMISKWELYRVVMDLENGSLPYLTFKQVKKNLGHGFMVCIT